MDRDAALTDTHHAHHASLRAATALPLLSNRVIHSSSIQIFLQGVYDSLGWSSDS